MFVLFKIPRPGLLLVIIIVISPKNYLIYGHHFNFVPDWPRVICAYSQRGDIIFNGAILNSNHLWFWAIFSPIFVRTKECILGLRLEEINYVQTHQALLYLFNFNSIYLPKLWIKMYITLMYSAKSSVKFKISCVSNMTQMCQLLVEVWQFEKS